MVGSFWVDDVALDGDDWFLTNATLLPAVASRRVSKLELFRGQGVRTAKGGWGLGSLTVDLVVPEGGTGSVSSRLRRLQALLAGSSEIRAELDGLPVMACEVVGVDMSDPSRVGIEVWSLQAKFTLQPFWVEDEQVDPAVYAWSGIVNGSPSTETIGGVLNRTNTANNPRFTSTSGTVEVRRNLANKPAGTSTYLNPGELGFSPRWAGRGGSQEISLLKDIQGPAGTGITTAIRKTWTVIGTELLDVAFSHASNRVNAYPVAPGEVFTISSYWRVSRSQNPLSTSRFNVDFYDSSGASVSSIIGSNYTGPVVADEWKKVSITFTVPEGVSFMEPYQTVSFTDITALQVGDTLDATGLLVEKSPILRPYFDGSYSPDPDLAPVWVGTENASQSYLRGFVPGNLSANNNFAVASSYGVRLIPNNTTSNDSNALVGGSSSSLSGYGVTFTPGKWYGIQAVCTLLAPQTGTLNGSARRMQLASNNVSGWTGARFAYPNQPTNESGSYQEELVTQLPTDSVWAGLYLYNGASFGNGDVYWDELLVVEGDTEEEVRRKLTQGYFDGASDSGMVQSLTGTGTLVFTQWGGSTGAIRDGILRVSGPATGVSITASDGTGLSFTQTLTASQCVFIDVERFRAWLGAATDWADTATAIPLDWPPAGPLVLKPSSDGVRLTLNGGTGLALKGRRWWL